MKENSHLKDLNWMVLDIETTGMDSDYDDIIDIGYLYFEGLKCTKKYSSLVKTDINLSPIIQKLTNITPQMVTSAPPWEKVQEDVFQYEPRFILAHNSKFEESFLKRDWIKSLTKLTEYIPHFTDSIPYFGLIFPGVGKLSLEFLLNFLQVKESEDHRGYEDSIDLLRCTLMAAYHLKQNKQLEFFFEQNIEQLAHLADSHFCFKFLQLSADELLQVADEIEFSLTEIYENFRLSVLEGEKNYFSNAQLSPRAADESDLNFDKDSISRFYQQENYLPKVVDEYQVRQSQIDFSLKVGQSLKNDIYTYIQAPTGTGKTLGYLLPIALMLLEDPEKKVIVSTGTKTLQDQIYEKDLGQLAKALGESFKQLKIVLLKGSKNHYCEVLFNVALEDSQQKGLLEEYSNIDRDYAFLFYKFLFYLNQVVPYEQKVTAEDVPYVLKRTNSILSDMDKEMRVDTNACTYGKCPHFANCSYFNGIMAAKEANLIVGNHALTLFWPESIDSGEYLIVDEAHKLEREITSAYTMNASPLEFDQIKKHLYQYMGSLLYLGDHFDSIRKKSEVIKEEFSNFLQRFTDNLDMLDELIESLFKKQPRYTSEYWNELPFIKRDKIKNSLESDLLNKIDSLKFIFTNFLSFLTPLEQMIKRENLNEDNANLAKTRFESFYGQIESVSQVLSICLGENEDYFSSIKYHEENGFSLSISPIDVGNITFEKLLQNRKSVIYSSATLANSDGSRGVNGINWLLGLNLTAPDRRFSNGLFLPPQFDYENNAKVYLCRDVPNIWNDDYVEKMVEHCEEIIHKLEGKTLFLFSSRKRFDKAVNILFDKFENKFPLFVQGVSRNVVQEFYQSENGILVGMESFSEGIDLPGEKLKLVIIDKIPDLSMDLVVGKRRDFYQRHFGNEFIDYYLSNRCRLLQQKMGRLLRRENDSGGIIVFDPRTKNWKGRTIEQFKSLMSPYKINFASPEEVKDQLLDYF
ncbi:exonuclease domain-containing protein [Bacteriovoracaceae bacterium]|nr:exonuclease domain-containing protein [Bacteriovoracaceae bacterium]